MLVALTALTLLYIAIVVVGHVLLAIALVAGLGDDEPGGRSRPVESMVPAEAQPLPAG
ncbi:MAG: hypothetical protein IT537_28005 [Hyphomicrobiales bacterium]|nr:hypothetical protein [Hyphomicrobiales bacterium]